ncbi:MAG TPA: hypothetical protein VFM93_06465 [Candidatus Limnocylindria bacterium]|nr:hypothetical protein [Candidatus Limnocylindria bacterium]
MNDRAIALALGIVASLAVAALSLGVTTDYDYYGRLAAAILDGRPYLDDAPSWLNELIPCGEARWCVVYPPLPALLAVPLAAFVTPAMAQELVSHLAAGASCGVLYLALRAYGAPRWVAVTGAVLSAFGTTLLFSAADARVWYAAHSVAVLFASAALLVAARGGPAWQVGALVGLAALARLPVAGAALGLALLAARRANAPFGRTLGLVVLGGLPFALAYVAWNLIRWGTVIDQGYALLTVDDHFFRSGLFSPVYLPRHLYAIFMEAPDLVEGEWAFLRPRIVGMSLFLTTPAFLWVFGGLRHVRRDAALGAVAVAAAVALVPDVLHGTVGFAQFGYRFSLDAQPFLVTLALAGDALRGGVWRERPSVLFVVATLAAIVVNVYAAVAIIHFGYWQ